jgi:hypothetical protein
MTTTSDERRAWVALAKETPQTYLVGARAEMLCVAVVRLVEEVGAMEQRAREGSAQHVRDILGRDISLANAERRIEALRAGLRQKATDFAFIAALPPHSSTTLVSWADARKGEIDQILDADKEATK